MRTNYKTLDNLLDNPSEVSEVMKDPARYGKELWEELSNQHKGYIMFAAAAGLLFYGLYLMKQDEEVRALEEQSSESNKGELP